MPLGDVGQLVGDDAGQFILGVEMGDKPRKYRDVPRRRSKSVQGTVPDHGRLDGKRLRRHGRNEAIHQ